MDPSRIPLDDPALQGLARAYRRALVTIAEQPHLAVEYIASFLGRLTSEEARKYHERYIGPYFNSDGRVDLAIAQRAVNAVATNSASPRYPPTRCTSRPYDRAVRATATATKEHKMRDITFVSPPFLGHLTQILALAENLAARGHVVHVVTSHTRAQEVREAGAKLIPWEIGDDGEALAAVWRHATRAPAWAGERIMLSYLVERYDSIYESLRKPLLARRGDIFVFDRALIPAMDLAFSEGMPFLILSRALGGVHGASWKYPLPYSSLPYPMTPPWRVLNAALRVWHIGVSFRHCCSFGQSAGLKTGRSAHIIRSRRRQ